MEDDLDLRSSRNVYDYLCQLTLENNRNPEMIPGHSHFHDLEHTKLFIVLFNHLISNPSNDVFYWEYCSLKTYENTFNQRFSEFKNKHIEAEVRDFIEIELNNIKGYTANKNTTFSCHSFKSIQLTQALFEEDFLYSIALNVKRKTEFLTQLLNDGKNDSNTHNYPEYIFTLKGYSIFLKLIENKNIADKGHNEDISFYYQQLKNDKWILSGSTHSDFKDWYNENYDFELNITSRSSKSRLGYYNRVLKLFK